MKKAKPRYPTLKKVQEDYIIKVLSKFKSNELAAEILGVARSSAWRYRNLYSRKIKKALKQVKR